MTTRMTVRRDLRPPVEVGSHFFMNNLYEVDLGTNSIVAYQKRNTIGIGFNKEPVSSNTSLPYTTPAEEIVEHIKINAGSIPTGTMLSAIRMIQHAIDKDQMKGIFNLRIRINQHKRPLVVEDCMTNGAFIVDVAAHSVCYERMGEKTNPIDLRQATLSEVMELGKRSNPRFEKFPGSVYELASHAMYAYLAETKTISRKDVDRLTVD